MPSIMCRVCKGVNGQHRNNVCHKVNTMKNCETYEKEGEYSKGLQWYDVGDTTTLQEESMPGRKSRKKGNSTCNYCNNCDPTSECLGRLNARKPVNLDLAYSLLLSPDITLKDRKTLFIKTCRKEG